MVEISITFFDQRKIKAGEKYLITVFEKTREEIIKKKKIKKDPIDEIIELLSEIKERYGNEKGKLIAVTIKSKNIVTRGAIITGDKSQEATSIMMFPDIARVDKITLYKYDNNSYRPISEWKPEKEYYVLYTDINTIPEDEIMIITTDKGSRIIGPEDIRLVSKRAKVRPSEAVSEKTPSKRRKVSKRRKRRT